MAELSEAESVRRLADRFGFGAGGEGLAALQQRGYDSAVEALLSPDGTDAGVQATPAPRLEIPARPAGGKEADRADRKEFRRQLKAQQLTLTAWWLDRMVQADQPLRERLTWFWHGHFATSVQKVRLAPLMLRQNETFRSARRRLLHRSGPRADRRSGDAGLAGRQRQHREGPEREPGPRVHGAVRPRPRPLQRDRRQGGRPGADGLEGEPTDRRRRCCVPQQHDDGDKTVLGQTGASAPRTWSRVLLDQPASAEFVIGRLWFRLVSAAGRRRGDARRGCWPRTGAAATSPPPCGRSAVDPEFRDPGTSLVKQPVEWLVGLGAGAGSHAVELPDEARRRRLVGRSAGMGQVPFRPPSVGGWPAGGAWLTTASAAARLDAARRAGRRGRPARRSGRPRPAAVRRRSAGCSASTPSPPVPRRRSSRSPTDRPTRWRWPPSPPSTSSPR